MKKGVMLGVLFITILLSTSFISAGSLFEWLFGPDPGLSPGDELVISSKSKVRYALNKLGKDFPQYTKKDMSIQPSEDYKGNKIFMTCNTALWGDNCILGDKDKRFSRDQSNKVSGIKYGFGGLVHCSKETAQEMCDMLGYFDSKYDCARAFSSPRDNSLVYFSVKEDNFINIRADDRSIRPINRAISKLTCSKPKPEVLHCFPYGDEIISFINNLPADRKKGECSEDYVKKYDTNGDGYNTPLDQLIFINLGNKKTKAAELECKGMIEKLNAEDYNPCEVELKCEDSDGNNYVAKGNWKLYEDGEVIDEDVESCAVSPNEGKVNEYTCATTDIVKVTVKSVNGKTSYWKDGKEFDEYKELLKLYQMDCGGEGCKDGACVAYPCAIVSCAAPSAGCVYTDSDELKSDGCPKYPCGLQVCEVKCTDSDGGKYDFFTPGETRYISQGIDDIDEDTCMDNNLLAEQYCSSPTSENEQNIVKCDNGCTTDVDGKGACIPGEKPYCSAIGTRSEGWYQTVSNVHRVIMNGDNPAFDQCNGCVAECIIPDDDPNTGDSMAIGWYSSCDDKTQVSQNRLIKVDVDCLEQKIVSITGASENYVVLQDIGLLIETIEKDGTVPTKAEGWDIQYYTYKVGGDGEHLTEYVPTGHYNADYSEVEGWKIDYWAPSVPGKYYTTITLYCARDDGDCSNNANQEWEEVIYFDVELECTENRHCPWTWSNSCSEDGSKAISTSINSRCSSNGVCFVSRTYENSQNCNSAWGGCEAGYCKPKPFCDEGIIETKEIAEAESKNVNGVEITVLNSDEINLKFSARVNADHHRNLILNNDNPITQVDIQDKTLGIELVSTDDSHVPSTATIRVTCGEVVNGQCSGKKMQWLWHNNNDGKLWVGYRTNGLIDDVNVLLWSQWPQGLECDILEKSCQDYTSKEVDEDGTVVRSEEWTECSLKTDCDYPEFTGNLRSFVKVEDSACPHINNVEEIKKYVNVCDNLDKEVANKIARLRRENNHISQEGNEISTGRYFATAAGGGELWKVIEISEAKVTLKKVMESESDLVEVALSIGVGELTLKDGSKADVQLRNRHGYYSIIVNENPLGIINSYYCYETASLLVNPGWNFRSTFAIDALFDLRNLNERELKEIGIRAIYYYDWNDEKYVEAISEREKMRNIMNNLGENPLDSAAFWHSSVWVYFDSDISETLEFKLRDMDYRLASINKVVFKEYWNFFSVTPQIIGKTLNEIKGDCEYLGAAFYNSLTQKWDLVSEDEMENTKLAESESWTGMIIKTIKECRLAIASQVPGLPAGIVAPPAPPTIA